MMHSQISSHQGKQRDMEVAERGGSYDTKNDQRA